MRMPTQIKQISDREWMFEWYGRIYTYFTSKDFNFTQVYSCNSKGVWIKPYICLSRNKHLPIAGDEQQVAEQLQEFMNSGANEEAKNLVWGHWNTMYNLRADQEPEYHSGDLQKCFPSRFKKPNKPDKL